MWRPDIVVVEKKFKNEMDRGTNYAARDYGGDELPNVFDGHHTKLPPVWPCPIHYLLLSHSFPSSRIIFVFLRFPSHSVLYNQYYTWNSPFRVRSPRPHPHQFRLTSPAFVASPFVYPHLSSHYQ
jgi:hypothetical protein